MQKVDDRTRIRPIISSHRTSSCIFIGTLSSQFYIGITAYTETVWLVLLYKELRRPYRIIALILVFHRTGKEHLTVHHLYMNARQIDGCFNNLGLPLILGRHADNVFIAGTICSPDNQGCRTCLMGHHHEFRP